jgi:hypothetical protein
VTRTKFRWALPLGLGLMGIGALCCFLSFGPCGGGLLTLVLGAVSALAGIVLCAWATNTL